MQAQKKLPIPFLPSRSLKKELDYLYARRSAIDNLIESLEDYSRFKAGLAEGSDKRRTA